MTVSGSGADYGHIGRIVQGQVWSVLAEGGGHASDIGQIILPKGTWMIVAGGYTPIIIPESKTTFISLGQLEAMQLLAYTWNIVTLRKLTDEETIKVKLTSWESESHQTTQNWGVIAVQLA